jgi:glycosyltransferase involved in cell wall biosynthesis
VLYDVIDALHPDVAGQPISDAVWERHRALLRDADAVIASAQELLAQVSAARTRPFALVGNGVDVEHFSAPRGARPPAPLEAVVARGQPVVGYFGALARWFDYGLMKRLALERPGLQLVLLGQDYDGSLAASGLATLPNVTAYGPVPYAELPRHAAWFDVATVPFVHNAITAATSPLKLFEALALGKAVVTTDLRECRQVRGARVARGAEEFLAAIDAAVGQCADPAVAQAARAEAHAHRWEEKAFVIAELLKEVLAQG